ncbi:MAG: ABC transporter ATP-binding protein [Gemmataceae bacterium]
MTTDNGFEHVLEDVTKHYEQGKRVVQAVRGVSLQIPAGEFLSIMGPSGSGKSTCMHLLGALDKPTSGRVLFRGRDLQKMSDSELSQLRRTKIGFVFQFFNLLPTLTAVENVALPLILSGMRRSKALKPAQAGLERVGLRERATHFPDELSGGEMQRVAIARALVIEPEAVLCDEPTGNLDTRTGHEILRLLRSLPEEGERSVVMVTHDAQAARISDRIVHIRDGVVEHEDIIETPELPEDIPEAEETGTERHF